MTEVVVEAAGAVRKAQFMTAVVLTGYGGYEKLECRTDVPVPVAGPNEVVIRVRAAAINNTDINTRIGWYSKSITGSTAEGVAGSRVQSFDADASWSGIPLSFPRIQGADCCGQIVSVGKEVDPIRMGERVIVRNMLRSYVNFRPFECWTFGSECDGAFAQFAKAPAADTYKVACDWSDVELASIPCAYSTAEGMLHRAGVHAGERVLITGASGGVGLAAIQLAKRRGAEVIAIAAQSKMAEVTSLGADHVLPRGTSIKQALGHDMLDVVIDVVAGQQWPDFIQVLRRGGRYAVAGAIAGPIVDLDVRTLYLKDLTFFGCTFQEDIIFENLVSFIERNEIRPLVAKTYPLEDIVKAQEDFLSKQFTGKLVLIPPA
jgi:NADPH:quinone reductase-like Zn-dependent oxidoreductase